MFSIAAVFDAVLGRSTSGGRSNDIFVPVCRLTVRHRRVDAHTESLLSIECNRECLDEFEITGDKCDNELHLELYAQLRRAGRDAHEMRRHLHIDRDGRGCARHVEHSPCGLGVGTRGWKGMGARTDWRRTSPRHTSPSANCVLCMSLCSAKRVPFGGCTIGTV